MNAREFGTLLRGFALAAAGLLLFLQGVEVAFIPVGEELGRSIALKWSPWWLVPIGFGLGFLATFAEPAVQLLSEEVYDTSAGAIPKSLILWTLAIGVGFSVALAIGRTILGNSSLDHLGARASLGALVDSLVRPRFRGDRF